MAPKFSLQRPSLHMAVLKGDRKAISKWHEVFKDGWKNGKQQNRPMINSWAWAKAGDTSLHYASRSGDAVTVEELLRSGMTPFKNNKNGENALTLAVIAGHTGVVETILLLKPNQRAIRIALARATTKEVVDTMLTFTRVNRRGSFLDVALCEAVEYRRPATVEALLRAGAYANIRNYYGSSLLSVASKTGNKKIVKLLLNSNANVNIKSSNGEGVLHCLGRAGDTTIIAILLKHGANVDELDSYNRTPLAYAASHGKIGVAEFLLQNGANVNHQDHQSWTALHEAAFTGKLNMARILLERGANPNLQNKAGKKPWEVATQHPLRELLWQATALIHGRA